MTSSYAPVVDRQATLPCRNESPITANLEHLQAKKNFSVSHLLDLEEAREMVGTQTEDNTGESGRNMLESPGLTSGSDTTQQESEFGNSIWDLPVLTIMIECCSYSARVTNSNYTLIYPKCLFPK